MLQKVLVQSVGTGSRPGSDITRPLLKSIRWSGPSFVVWIVSLESQPYAEQMRSELGLSEDDYAIFLLRTSDNVEEIYRECRKVLREVVAAKGFVPDQIEVDYTSGTKAMTAGLALAAVAHRCGLLKYLTGTRQHGLVVDDTEREERLEPRRVWADEQVALARDYCQALQFESALTLLETVKPQWLGEYEHRLVEGIKTVANGYGSWDRFDYARANGELRKVLNTPLPELSAFVPSPDLPRRVLVLKYEDPGQNGRWEEANFLDMERFADRIADLFNNSHRRVRSGRFDDALARFYRLAEMLAQGILVQGYGICSAQVSLESVPAAMRDPLVGLRNDHGEIQIGLTWSYRLLKALDHPIGQAFFKDRDIQMLLNKRNSSLLAHGLKPIGRSEVEGLASRLEALVRLHVPDLADRRRALEFPWLAHAEG